MLIIHLWSSHPESPQEHDLDIWHATPSYIDIFSPLDAPPLPPTLQSLPHITTQISAPVISTNHLKTDWNLSSLENTTFHDSYHPLSQIENFMRDLADTHPQIAHLNILGRTAEGRDIFGLTISTGLYDDEHKETKKKKKKRLRKQREKLSFVIQGAQHAREVLWFLRLQSFL